MKNIHGYMVAESHNEITMSVLKRLHEVGYRGGDDHDVYAAFLNMDREEVLAIPVPDIDKALNEHLSSWYFNVFDWETLPMPDAVEIMGKTIKIPKDLTLETYGQKILAERAMIENAGADVIGLSSKIVAIYLHNKVFDTKLSDEHIEELEKVINESPAFIYYPIASFFLQSLLESLRLKAKNYAVSRMRTALRQE